MAIWESTLSISVQFNYFDSDEASFPLSSSSSSFLLTSLGGGLVVTVLCPPRLNDFKLTTVTLDREGHGDDAVARLNETQNAW